MRLDKEIRRIAAQWCRRRRFERVYKRFQEFTMVPADTYIDNLQLAEQISELSGCVVECGVWRGGMIAGISTILGAQRQYFLFDSFEGLPAAKEIDGKRALQWQANKNCFEFYENCKADQSWSQRAMALAGISSFHTVKGWFESVLPAFSPPEPIALLRLDADWYESTTVCLDSLFNHVAVGGLVILDDYYAWDGCSRALHDFLSRRSAVERIRSLGSVCFIEKSEP